MDLNCDLGEGEPAARTRALMKWIRLANIACGGHAGDAVTMAACLKLCREHDVRPGAHPGYPNRADMGRGEVAIDPAGLRLLLLHQVSALDTLARAQGLALTHVKLHGTLYHATDGSPALARAYLDTVRDFWPSLAVVARLGGGVARLGARSGLTVWTEAFADRRYRPDGTLAPRDEPGAVLDKVHEVRLQVLALREQGLADTVCLHGDSPGAPVLARHIAAWLRD
jgi:UPF0271 protein